MSWNLSFISEQEFTDVNPEQWRECTVDGVTVRAGKVLPGCVFVGEEKE